MIMSKIIQNRKLGSVNQTNKTFGEMLSARFCHTFKKTVSKNSKSGYKTKVTGTEGISETKQLKIISRHLYKKKKTMTIK
jgi:hypothetical protein